MVTKIENYQLKTFFGILSIWNGQQKGKYLLFLARW